MSSYFYHSPKAQATANLLRISLGLGFSVSLFCSINSFAAESSSTDAHASVKMSGQAQRSHVHNMHFATVNGQEISFKEFQSAFQAGVKKRFYHGKIPPKELQAFKEEVSQTLIDRVLLLGEAKRRNIVTDSQKVNTKIAEYERRYADKPFWSEHKDDVVSGLRSALDEQYILEALEASVKEIDLPTIEQAEAFYTSNPALFTTPEKTRVSLILLKVLPSSPASVWEAARQEADHIIQRLKKGSKFSQLARIHSGDASASKGGDMGFMHKGMLAEPAQIALTELKEGELSAPIMLLKGVAILKLESRQAATLNSFENVKLRAQQLLQRDTAKMAWFNLAEKLRVGAEIKINAIAMGLEQSTEKKPG